MSVKKGNALLKNVYKDYENTKKLNLLCKIDFVTVKDYLFLLRRITQIMSVCKANALYYLAAAVSDFYLPPEKMVEHKIQSNHVNANQGLQIQFDNVPKMIKPLVTQWALNGYIVSFKLETDPDLLLQKSLTALKRYGHQVVIGNVLNTRKLRVLFISSQSEGSVWVELSNEELENGIEIESRIVEKLIQMHSNWISSFL